jgi:hypothetical protein
MLNAKTRIAYILLLSIFWSCSISEKPKVSQDERLTLQDTFGSNSPTVIEKTKNKEIQDGLTSQGTTESQEAMSSNIKDQPKPIIKASSATNTSSCEKCSFDILVLLEEAKENPPQSVVSSFVCTFSEKMCVNNVEFEEFYTELLFDLLAYSPSKLFESLAETSLDKSSLIIQMIESPVNDLYSMGELIKIVETVSERSDVKVLVVKSLEVARSKMN